MSTAARIYSFSGYRGASHGKRLADWMPTGAGPNTVLQSDMAWLRRRSLDLFRNNPYIRKAVRDLVSAEIGIGMAPIFRGPYRAEAKEIWRDWESECDADGLYPFGGLLYLATQTRLIQGECFIRLRPRRAEDGLSVPLQLQLIPPDQLDIGFNVRIEGGVIIQGIEFDRIGRRRAYHFWPSNPNESWPAPSQVRVRVPAEFVLHHFCPTVPGQIRGEPLTATVMVEAHDYDDYRDAELSRKKARAHYTGAITRPAYDEMDYRYDPMTGVKLPERGESPPTFELQPATFQALYPGEQLQLFDGDTAGDGYAEFQRDRLSAQAAGLGVPYEHVSGDYRGINDRLYRALLLAYHRQTEIAQQNLPIHQICEPVKNLWLDYAVMAEALDIPDYVERKREHRRVAWRTHAHKDIYPLQEAQTKRELMETRLKSRHSLILEMGGEPEDVDQEIDDDPHHPIPEGSDAALHTGARTDQTETQETAGEETDNV